MTLTDLGELVRSAIAWALVFLSYELPAHFRLSKLATSLVVAPVSVVVVLLLWPILTLSGTVWGGDKWWHGLVPLGLAFLAVLGLHFYRHVSARWLILSALIIACAIVGHVLAQRHGAR